MWNNNTSTEPGAELPEEAGSTFSPDIILYGVNTPVCAAYLINKPEFILGKGENCDGIISFSPEISHNHAQITWENGTYYITDLKSTNRTFLNGKALPPEQKRVFRSGDRITLSTFIFQAQRINK